LTLIDFGWAFVWADGWVPLLKPCSSQKGYWFIQTSTCIRLLVAVWFNLNVNVGFINPRQLSRELSSATLPSGIV